MMRFLDLTLPDLADNLALDEALLLEAEAGGGEALRVWHWPGYAVVLGAGGRLADDVDETNCLVDGIPIHRRGSGGGTVLVGSGCLLFSLILAYDRHPALAEVISSYQFILEKIIGALTPLAGGLSQEGISDLVLDGRKFSGNAQQRKRCHLLHHGTILTDFDPAMMGRYLKPPIRQPDYRQHRPHEAFVRNFPAPAPEIVQQLKLAWDALEERTEAPLDQVAALVAEKYGQEWWIRRR